MTASGPTPGRLRRALAGVRGLLLDLDGVIVLAGKPVPGAPEAVRDLTRRGISFRDRDGRAAGRSPRNRRSEWQARACRTAQAAAQRRGGGVPDAVAPSLAEVVAALDWPPKSVSTTRGTNQ